MASNNLRSRQERRRQTSGNRPASADVAQHLDFVSDREYDPPMLGIQRSTGQPVSILERGNTAGMSVTWLVATPGGVPMILGLNDVQLTGSTTGLIPPPVSQLEAIFDSVKFDDA